MYTILHLSDLHFGDSHYFDQGVDEHASGLAEAISQAVFSLIGNKKIDALVLTGDFFSQNLASDRASAGDGIANLMQQLKISPEHIVSIPGNHDLSWDPKFQRQPFRFYDELVNDAKIKGYTSDKFPGLLELSPKANGDKGIAFVLMNSCVMEGAKTAGFGRIGDRQLSRLTNLLAEAKITSDTHVLIAALHHHLLPVVPLVRNWSGPDPKDGTPVLSSLTVDAVAVLQRLNELGFSLAIHGHQHRPAVRLYEDILLGTAGIGICAAGSCGAKGAPRQFFLYEVDDLQTKIWSFMQSPHNESVFTTGRHALIVPNTFNSRQVKNDIHDGLHRAGIRSIYSNRQGFAQEALREAFETHFAGEIRLTGPSLRLFLAPGHHFYEYIQDLLSRSEGQKSIRAVFCNPECNRELPVRSFIEEFDQEGNHPRVHAFDWSRKIKLDFKNFEKSFFDNYGPYSGKKLLRVIQDIKSTRTGVEELRGFAQSAGNSIRHRETLYAPYCTAVIFPDKAFYTPNLLSTKVPVNCPMMVFDGKSAMYQKLSEYFEFQWWLADPNASGLQEEE